MQHWSTPSITCLCRQLFEILRPKEHVIPWAPVMRSDERVAHTGREPIAELFHGGHAGCWHVAQREQCPVS